MPSSPIFLFQEPLRRVLVELFTSQTAAYFTVRLFNVGTAPMFVTNIGVTLPRSRISVDPKERQTPPPRLITRVPVAIKDRESFLYVDMAGVDAFDDVLPTGTAANGVTVRFYFTLSDIHKTAGDYEYEVVFDTNTHTRRHRLPITLVCRDLFIADFVPWYTQFWWVILLLFCMLFGLVYVRVRMRYAFLRQRNYAKKPEHRMSFWDFWCFTLFFRARADRAARRRYGAILGDKVDDGDSDSNSDSSEGSEYSAGVSGFETGSDHTSQTSGHTSRNTRFTEFAESDYLEGAEGVDSRESREMANGMSDFGGLGAGGASMSTSTSALLRRLSAEAAEDVRADEGFDEEVGRYNSGQAMATSASSFRKKKPPMAKSVSFRLPPPMRASARLLLADDSDDDDFDDDDDGGGGDSGQLPGQPER
jgi:hypothetical protein